MSFSRWSRLASCFLLALVITVAGVPRVAMSFAPDHHASHEMQHDTDCHSALPDDQGAAGAATGHDSCCCIASACSFSMMASPMAISLVGNPSPIILPPLTDYLAERSLSPPTEPPRA
jgi:hypothetical protein